MPCAAALAVGMPLAAGAALGRLDAGVAGSLGGLAFLYLPMESAAASYGGDARWRMTRLAVCAVGLTASFLAGAASASAEAWRAMVVAGLAAAAALATRKAGMGPPGALFFVMAAAIGAYAPGAPDGPLLRTAWVALGALGALGVGALHCCRVRHRGGEHGGFSPAKAPPGRPWADAIVVGGAAGLALGAAEMWRMEKPYWAPVACVAVLQGATLRAVWRRKLHRVVGTVAGMGIAWLVLATRPDAWAVCALAMALMFAVESTVTRHYALAAMFITPLAILLAEAGSRSTPPGVLLQARLLETALGCAAGLAGGALRHAWRPGAPD